MNNKKISIYYGSKIINAQIPGDRLVFEGNMKYIPPISNFQSVLLSKLENPTGCESLKDIIYPEFKILILIEDNTRNTPVKYILTVLVYYIKNFKIKLSNIEILIALGTHRIMTEEEIIKKVGKNIVKKIKIYQHNFEDENSLINLGFVDINKRKTPILVNEKVLRADFIIGIGNIIPHSDAGFSGGAKIVQPGICGYSTTASTHIAAALLDEIPLGFAENPCRLAMELVANKVGLNFIINVIMNYKNEVIDIVAGNFVKAHREGAKVSKKSYGVEIPELADIVITSSFPCDIDYWQAEKGLISAYFTVKKGGYIIFVTPCYEGLEQNHPKLREWLKLTYSQACKLAKTISLEDKKMDLISADLAICNSRIREKCNIIIVSDGLAESDIEILGYKKINKLQKAIDFSLDKIPDAKIGILPRGGDCLPLIKDKNNKYK